MKKIYLLLISILMSYAVLLAQTPGSFKYQAVLRNTRGTPLQNKDVELRISILQTSMDGSAVYTELYNITTNLLGMVNLNIGTGESTDDFSAIDWGIDLYFLKVEMAVGRSQRFVEIGTSQLLSVPYALHAKTAKNLSGGITETDPVFGESVAGGITVADTANWTQNLSIKGNQLTISTGNTVTLPGGSVPVYTAAQIDALTPAQGDAVFNSTDKLFQIYDGSAWQSFNSNCWPQTTVANAGSDQIFTDGTITAGLSANTPEAGYGTGEWTIISGESGSFANAADPATTFTGSLLEDYILRWTITTNCNSSTDDLIIIFGQDIGAGSTVTDYDGNTYYTITIGAQEWMAENLKVTHYADGTAIPLVTDNTAWENLSDDNTDKAYCYNNNNANGEADTYGALYTYAAATNGDNDGATQGVCPMGWHLPGDAEWKELEMYLGISQAEADAAGFRGTNEGSKLAGNAALWSNGALEQDAAFGTSGFTALPGGCRIYYYGSFSFLDGFGTFWSATESSATDAWGRGLSPINVGVSRGSNNGKSYGFSVRCLRD